MAGCGEILISCENLEISSRYFIDILKFKLESIYPADSPSTALIIGYGLRLKLILNQERDSTQLILYCNALEDFLHINPHPDSKESFFIETPNGTKILISLPETFSLPPLQESLVLTHYSPTDSGDWGIGRAGMRYRDLIPNRLGGKYIASHIHIPTGGPVPDYVHYHQVRFQMIYCYRGRVRVVYEDQGEPFFLESGDCVIQPPEIRHRVLECSDDLHVIEIGCPAIHKTIADFNLSLPNPALDTERLWANQKFVRFISSDCDWQTASNQRIWNPESEHFENLSTTTGSFSSQWTFKETGIRLGTDGLADVIVLRSVARTNSETSSNEFTSHHCDFFFLFVLVGGIELQINDMSHVLSEGSSVTIPSRTPFLISPCDVSQSVQILKVVMR
jgi:quercetin dioxygenase-like cupin family protein